MLAQNSVISSHPQKHVSKKRKKGARERGDIMIVDIIRNKTPNFLKRNERKGERKKSLRISLGPLSS
jgi:hypothetical protein